MLSVRPKALTSLARFRGVGLGFSLVHPCYCMGSAFEGPLGTAWSPNAVPLLIEPRGQFSLGWCGVLSVDLRPQGQILRSLRGLELGN